MIFAMENLLVSRSDLLCDFIDVVRRKGYDAARSTPVHLVDHDAGRLASLSKTGVPGAVFSITKYLRGFSITALTHPFLKVDCL